jgi:hypothetical protein
MIVYAFGGTLLLLALIGGNAVDRGPQGCSMKIVHLSKGTDANVTRYAIQFHKWIGFGINNELPTGPIATPGCITFAIVRPFGADVLSQLKAVLDQGQKLNPKGPPCS